MDPLTISAQLAQAGLCPPETLTLAITGECNLHCAHCWVDAGPTASALLPVHTAQGLIEEFAGFGGTAVRLTGGEPLLHPDWLACQDCCCCWFDCSFTNQWYVVH